MALDRVDLEEGFDIGMVYQASLAYLPATWVMLGLVVVLLSWAPKLTGFIWLYLAFSFFVVYLDGLLQISDWVVKLSPFGYVSGLPIEQSDLGTAVITTLVALGLLIMGFMGYRKRDLSI